MRPIPLILSFLALLGTPLPAQVIRLATVPASLQTTFVSESLLRDQVLKKQLAAKGYSLVEQTFRNGAAMVPQLDQLEIMLMGDTAALVAIHKAPLGVFLTVGTAEMTFLAKQRLKPEQLKGLKVGFSTGTVAHYGVWRMLKQAKLTMNDVVQVPVFADKAEVAMAEGTIDATSTYIPFTTGILEHIKGATMISQFEVRSFLLMSLAFADQHPDLKQAILAAVVRASRWIKQSEANTNLALKWIQAAQQRYLGTSSLTPQEPWTSELRRETLDNPSYPMLHQEITEEAGILHEQFVFLKETNQIPAEARWSALVPFLRWEDLSQVLANPGPWDLNRFDYTMAP